ncbi:glycosyltransferase family 2 protein, partial [Thermodesulfobacteriota bacterium]
MTKISVITVVHNAALTIRDCIESVKSQVHKAEHIIIDGASTDGTLDIVKEYRTEIARVISEPDSGIYDAMNKGIPLATGDVVGFLNADDFYPDPEVLSNVADIFEDGRVESCYGDLVYVHPTKPEQTLRFWQSGEYDPERFYWGWMPPHPTFFVTRSTYEKHGYFNLDFGSAADYELMLRFLLKHRIRTAYIPAVLVKMRSGGTSNVSIRNRLLANKNDRLAWKENGLKPHPWTLWFKPLRKIPQYFSK